MGIFFTLLYLFTAYLTPTEVFGDLAQYHIEVYIAVVALLASLPNVSGSGLLKMPQTLAILGMMAAVALSLLFNGVGRSIPDALILFLTGSIVYFFVLWNFRTLVHLRLLIALLLLIALITVCQGAVAINTENVHSPWVFVMGHIGENPLLRICGLGFINDPNDLCQFLVGLVPCVFIFWKAGQAVRNALFVLLPVSILLYGMFLTHSRGGMVGLLAPLMLLGRRRFGILPAVITGAVLFVALSAIGWSGGRDINAESGADRMEAWSTGLTLIRTHPIFGVGFRRFEEYYYITAHNTVVVCAAEIGLFGFFFWTLMVVPTLYELALARRAPLAEDSPEDAIEKPSRGLPGKIHGFKLPDRRPALQMAFAAPSPKTASMETPIVQRLTAPSRGVFSPAAEGSQSLPGDELRRLCGLMTLSLTGFFGAGWFLSRSYTTVLFVNIGMALAVHRMAVEGGVAANYLPLSKAAKYSAIATAVLIAAVYILLRATNLMPK